MKKEIKEKIKENMKKKLIEIYEANHREHKNCNTRSGECSCEADELADQILQLFKEEKEKWIGDLRIVLFEKYLDYDDVERAIKDFKRELKRGND